MNVVRPTVQKNYRRTVGGTLVGVSDVEESGVDLFDRAERRVGRTPGRRRDCRVFFVGSSFCSGEVAEARGGDGHRRGAEKPAAIIVGLFRHPSALQYSNGWAAKQSDSIGRWYWLVAFAGMIHALGVSLEL